MDNLAFPLALLLAPLPWLLARLGRQIGGEGGGLWLPIAPPVNATQARDWLLWPIWLLLVLALAGPRLPLPAPGLPTTGRDLAVALDLSGSMVQRDYELDGQTLTRLEAVKTVGAAFVRGRGGDRVALIVFGSEAYYAAPFSHDVEAVAKRIEEAQIGISGRATNISDALGLALKRMAGSEAAAKVVVLLSDGVNNAGKAHPRAVAALAAEQGVTVHTIAMGTLDLADAPEARSAVDVATLRAMAELSGGRFFRVRDMGDLQAVLAEIDALERDPGQGMPAEIYRPLWLWPAGLALILAALSLGRRAV